MFGVCFTLSGCGVGKDEPQVVEAERVTLSSDAVNINNASAEELEKLPYIGEKLARQIVEYRERNGSFRKPEHLMMIPGISDKRFRQIRTFIKVD